MGGNPEKQIPEPPTPQEQQEQEQANRQRRLQQFRQLSQRQRIQFYMSRLQQSPHLQHRQIAEQWQQRWEQRDRQQQQQQQQREQNVQQQAASRRQNGWPPIVQRAYEQQQGRAGASGGNRNPPGRRMIWRGILEWSEMGENASNTQREVPAYVSPLLKKDEPYINAGSWPRKLKMDKCPRSYIRRIGPSYVTNAKIVDFHLIRCEDLSSIRKVINADFFGLVRFNGDPSSAKSDAKILVIFPTADKNIYRAFIPNDRKGFLDRLRKVDEVIREFRAEQLRSLHDLQSKFSQLAPTVPKRILAGQIPMPERFLGSISTTLTELTGPPNPELATYVITSIADYLRVLTADQQLPPLSGLETDSQENLGEISELSQGLELVQLREDQSESQMEESVQQVQEDSEQGAAAAAEKPEARSDAAIDRDE